MPPLSRHDIPPSSRPLTVAVMRRKSRPVNPPDPPPVHRAHRGHVPDDPLRQEEQQQAAAHARRAAARHGVRTIGGMYATVKEVNEDTVLLDAGPGVRRCSSRRTPSAPSSTDDEYNRIVHGIEHELKPDEAVVPDDASLTETDEPADDAPPPPTTSPSTSARRTRPTSRPTRSRGEGRRGDGRRRRAEEDRRRGRREVATPREHGATARFARPGTCCSRRSPDTMAWPPRAHPAQGGPRGSTRRWQHRRRAGAREPRASRGARWP